VHAARYVIDVRDEDPDTRLAIVDTEHGCHRCHFAGTCSAVCPKMVDPAQAIQRLRSILFKKKLGLWRKKKTAPIAGPQPRKAERKPLPPEAEFVVPDLDIDAMEKEPITVEVDGMEIPLTYDIG